MSYKPSISLFRSDFTRNIIILRNVALRALNYTSSTAASASNNEPWTFIKTNWKYKVIQMYKLDNDEFESSYESLPKLLHRLYPSRFRSASQARKACHLGEVIRFRTNKDRLIEQCEEYLDDNDFTNLGELGGFYNIVLCSSSSTVMKDDIIAIRSRANHTGSIYPTASVGYIDPPPNMIISGSKVELIYEDDLLCLVNKPDLLTTVGEKRNDLQSMLPFIMQPPSKQYWQSTKAPPLPRPVHRLDKKASGLVLVAKTKESMSRLSQNFSSRQVKKSYAALVFGRPQRSNIEAAGSDNCDSWNTIDYPIDGKASITLWRSVCSIDTVEFGQLTLLLCRPKTGRYHQIRRHLAYCLGTAIVGDSKYDEGGSKEKTARSLGMFLCSNAIEFKYPTNDWKRVLSTKTVATSFTSFAEYAADGLLGTSCNDDVTMVNYENGDGFVHLRAKIPLSEKFRTMLDK